MKTSTLLFILSALLYAGALVCAVWIVVITYIVVWQTDPDYGHRLSSTGFLIFLIGIVVGMCGAFTTIGAVSIRQKENR